MKQKYLLVIIFVLVVVGVGVIYKQQQTQTTASSSAKANNESYKDYSPQLLENEQAEGKKVVLFFFADWCPECRKAEEDFLNNTDSIPAGVTVLKVIFRSDQELERKYGILSRHTFVQLDGEGKMVTKWVSGNSEELKKNIK